MKKKSAILFYVLSVLFLIITIFVTAYGWINLASSAEQAGGIITRTMGSGCSNIVSYFWWFSCFYIYLFRNWFNFK